MLVLLSSLAWANCSLEALDAELQAAKLAAEGGRLDRRRRRVILDQLACTREPVDPHRVAEVHTVLGLFQHQQGDTDMAARHLLAAWEAAPLVPAAIVVPEELQAAHMQLQEEHFQAQRPVTSLDAMEPTRVDGLFATWRTTGMPALLQPNGRGVELVTPSSRSGTSTAKKGGPNTGLLVAGVVAAVAGGGMYGGAWAARGSYNDAVATGADDATIKGAHSTNRALSVASVGALGLGGVLIGLSF